MQSVGSSRSSESESTDQGIFSFCGIEICGFVITESFLPPFRIIGTIYPTCVLTRISYNSHLNITVSCISNCPTLSPYLWYWYKNVEQFLTFTMPATPPSYISLPAFIMLTVLIRSANYRLKCILIEDCFVIEFGRVYTRFLSVLGFV